MIIGDSLYKTNDKLTWNVHITLLGYINIKAALNENVSNNI